MPQRKLSGWRLFLLVEVICAMAGLFMPIMPTKTGAMGALPKALLDDPSYLEQALVYFLFNNIVAGAIVLIEIWLRRRERSSSPEGAGCDDPAA